MGTIVALLGLCDVNIDKSAKEPAAAKMQPSHDSGRFFVNLRLLARDTGLLTASARVASVLDVH